MFGNTLATAVVRSESVHLYELCVGDTRVIYIVDQCGDDARKLRQGILCLSKVFKKMSCRNKIEHPTYFAPVPYLQFRACGRGATYLGLFHERAYPVSIRSR